VATKVIRKTLRTRSLMNLI